MARPVVHFLCAVVALTLVCCAPVGAVPRPTVHPQPAPTFSAAERARIQRLQPLVRRIARRHRVPWPLVDGVIWVESRFQVRARGRRGPRGLMQLMPRTARAIARDLGRRYRPLSADFNVDAGTFYLRRMLQRFDGDRTLALCAYQRGPGAVRRMLQRGAPLPARSERYVGRVLAAAAVFRARYAAR